MTENMIQSLNADGFTLGTNHTVNRIDTRYYWMAFRAGAGTLKVGSYAGNGTSQSITDMGFLPEYVIVLPAHDKEAVQHSSAMTTTFFFNGDTGGSNRITSLNADGFSVGDSSRVNTAGKTYHYVAWNQISGKMNVGSYSGNGADNRNITGVGFQPGYVIIRPAYANAGGRHNAQQSD